MLQICKEIFSQLNTCVRYCHWKSNEHLMEGLEGKTDLDLLVDKKHARPFRNILMNNKCIKVRPQYGSRYPYVEEWIGFDGDTGCLIHLHVHFRVITGKKHVKEYILADSGLVLDTRVIDGDTGVYITDPNLEIIFLYMRIVLKETMQIQRLQSFAIGKDYKREIAWLKKRISYPQVESFARQMFSDDAVCICNIIQKHNPDKNDFGQLQLLLQGRLKTADSLIFNTAKHYMYKKVVGCKRFIVQKCDRTCLLLKKACGGRGLVIAFIGCDGSGKSTVTTEIKKWLDWKMDCRRFYFGMGDGYKKPLVYRLAHMQWMPSSLGRFFRVLFFYQLSVRNVRIRKRMEAYVKKGGIAICDRYPQTQFEGIYDGPKINALGLSGSNYVMRLFARMEKNHLERVVKNAPDCVFKLVTPPNVALKRSPGHNRNEVVRKAKLTEQLSFPDSTVYRIDTNMNYDEEMLEIRRHIWAELLQRR